MRTLLACLLLLQWTCCNAGIICAGVECVDGATCVGVTCMCPPSHPHGNGKFYCYSDPSRLVAIEFGDPYVKTFIPSEKYKIPLPCGHLVFRGDLASECYVSVYANGVDLDSDIQLTKAFVNGLEALVRKGDKETRMHIEDDVTFAVDEITVDHYIHNGVLNINVPECSFKMLYRHENAFVVIDIPVAYNHYDGSMLPSKELHETIDQQAVKYNLTRKQEILYASINGIDSKFAECQDLRDALGECDNVADEDVATSICGQYVYTDAMANCIGKTMSAKLILQKMRRCFIDICWDRKPPCEVIDAHFSHCKSALRGSLDHYNCSP